jgi:hypothetical protein
MLAREDLRAIREIMQGSHRVARYAAPHFVLWGLLMAAALCTTYFLLMGGVEGVVPWLWVAAVGAGWIGSAAISVSARHRAPVHSTASRMLGGLWLGTGITLTILGFVGAAGGGISSLAVTGVLAAVLGVGYFATGVLAETRWLLGVGAGWWGGAVFMLLWPGTHGLLVMAAMMLVLQAVPGLYYMRGARREEARG